MSGIVFMASETKNVCDYKTTTLVKSPTARSDTTGSLKVSKSGGSPKNRKLLEIGCREN
jgi:hypothetical protein